MKNRPLSEIFPEGNYLAHYNHNHDALGRFSSSSGSGGGVVRSTVQKIGKKVKYKRDTAKLEKAAKKVIPKVDKKSRKQKSEEASEKKVKDLQTARQRREAASKVVNSGSAKQVLANKDYLTTKQLQDAVTRINTEQQLASIMRQQNPSKLEKISKIVTPQSIKKVSEYGDALIDVYNTGARVANVTRKGDNKLKYIGKAENKSEGSNITSATVQEILKNASNYTDNQVKATLTREQNLAKLRDLANGQTVSSIPTAAKPGKKLKKK